jgi:hypothetical protein
MVIQNSANTVVIVIFVLRIWDMSNSSWYVEELLRNREFIKSRIKGQNTNAVFDSFMPYSINSISNSYEIEDSIDFEDEDYNNLLIAERKLDELINKGMFSETEVTIIGGILNYKPPFVLAKVIGLDHHTIQRIFSNVCNRVASDLGDGFTDEGYLLNLAEKYKLNKEQLEIARKYMNRYSDKNTREPNES